MIYNKAASAHISDQKNKDYSGLDIFSVYGLYFQGSTRLEAATWKAQAWLADLRCHWEKSSRRIRVWVVCWDSWCCSIWKQLHVRQKVQHCWLVRLLYGICSNKFNVRLPSILLSSLCSCGNNFVEGYDKSWCGLPDCQEIRFSKKNCFRQCSSINLHWYFYYFVVGNCKWVVYFAKWIATNCIWWMTCHI